MPVYEYRCSDCRRKFQVLIGMTAEPDSVKCPACGSIRADKLVSRFARYRNEDDRLDEIADRLELGGDPESPSQMREMMREVGKALDEDVSDEMEELFEADPEGTADAD